MLTFKANRGNLLQHWVLCEIVDGLKQAYKENTSLSFVDANAMAPFSLPETGHQQTRHIFEAVRNSLGSGTSGYEKAWSALRQTNPLEYPASAVFVHHLWGRSLRLLLSEIDPERATAIREWLDPNVGVLFEGDWRVHFHQRLTTLSEICFVSFDPYMYEKNPSIAKPRPELMYPQDLCLIVEALRDIECPVVIQLSTYDANNDNGQDSVEKSIRSILEPCGYKVAALVKADGAMMSFVILKNTDALQERFADLPKRFTRWLNSI